MSVALKIAWRYFFSKSGQTVINRINSIALLVIIVATSALMIVLSAFSGLKDFGLSFSNIFDPDFRIIPKLGKTISLDSSKIHRLEKVDGIKAFSPILEEKVFLSFKEKNQVAHLKGVGLDYLNVIPADSLVSVGEWLVPESNAIVAGYGIGADMDLGVYDYGSFLNISIPRKNLNSSLRQNPFYTQQAVTIGLYQISEDIDKKYIFSTLDFARDLLQYPQNVFSSIEIKASPEANSKDLKKKIQKIMGDSVQIKDRTQINTALYKMLNTEHLAIYLIFTLVLIVALFNVVGALVMMILDKKPQMNILKAMGITQHQLGQTFFLLGMMIVLFGGIIGLVLSSVLILIQQWDPFINIPGTSLAYPIKWEFENILIVMGTLLLLGSLASAWASRGANR
ncbi:MAG: FtsX-like permease family protein [Bacteroidota bacterium]|nr:FtsX-like permease family protein [Bacteroidota bacterium]